MPSEKTPDELHEEYFKKNPYGNHSFPAPETKRFIERQEKINDTFVTKSEFSELREDIEKDNNSFSERLKIIESELAKKINTTAVVLIISIAISGVSGMFYLVYNQNLKISEKQDLQFTKISERVDGVAATGSQTQSAVSYIKGILDNPGTKISN